MPKPGWIPLLAPDEFKASGGLGVQARINGSLVMVGKPDWFRDDLGISDLDNGR